jgi:hypothetical protein
MSQLSFFSAESLPASPLDVEGLLAGPGQLSTRGAEVRISVVVADGWRVAALVQALAERDLGPEAATGEAGSGTVVRSAFSPLLAPLGRQWTSGAVKRPPPGLVLDGPRLRWWCIAAGHGEEAGYTLALGRGDEASWPGVGAALAQAGIPAALVRPRGAGPVYRIVGRRRLARLRELVGGPPAGAPAADWPAAQRRGG